MEQLKEIESDISKPAIKKGKYLSNRSKDNRKKMPTMFEAGKLQISEKVARSCREETCQAALEVHGGEGKSAEVGVIDTVLSKCSKTTLGEVLSTSNKLQKCFAKAI